MVNYTTSFTECFDHVSQATPTINWNNPADINIWYMTILTAYATALINVIPAVQQGVSLTITNQHIQQVMTSVGQTITYTYNVTNSGNKNISAPITSLLQTTRLAQYLYKAAGILSPCSSVTGTATYKITDADINTGSVAMQCMQQVHQWTDNNFTPKYCDGSLISSQPMT